MSVDNPQYLQRTTIAELQQLLRLLMYSSAHSCTERPRGVCGAENDYHRAIKQRDGGGPYAARVGSALHTCGASIGEHLRLS